MRIGIRALTVLPWVLLPAVATGLAATGTEDVKVQIRREAVLSLLTAAVPYKVEVGASLLRETLTFTEPKELRFAEGKITFAVRCQGSPFPVDQVIHPVFAFRRGTSGYQLVADSLPVGIPGFGRVDLKDLFPPVELQALLRQALNLSGRPTLLEVRVEQVEISKYSIELSARLLLTPLAAR
ncbi:MAG: hypothetical protein L0Z52_03715 [Acidobacteria bacterium]|nr:hypothetical protein [Acidobacteriota bacterium]